MSTTDAMMHAPLGLQPTRAFGRAWCAIRAITKRQWLWASGLGLVASGFYLAGYAPRVLSDWQAPQIAAKAVYGVLGAYVILLAVAIAEYRIAHDESLKWRYLAAAICATFILVATETTIAAVLPITIAATGPQHIAFLLGVAVSSLMNWSLCGGLAIAVYVRLQAVRRTRAAIRAAELARARASRKVLASRLAAMQAQVEPRLLLVTLEQAEALCNHPETAAGAKMIDCLIGYLRTALPELRGDRSTLGREAQLARRYLELVQLGMGGRFRFAIDVPSELADFAMPPMVLLPLIERPLRSSGAVQLPARIDVIARSDGNQVRVTVTDDGVAPGDGPDNAAHFSALRMRLEANFGESARLHVVRHDGRGVTTVIELPHERERPPPSTNQSQRGAR